MSVVIPGLVKCKIQTNWGPTRRTIAKKPRSIKIILIAHFPYLSGSGTFFSYLIWALLSLSPCWYSYDMSWGFLILVALAILNQNWLWRQLDNKPVGSWSHSVIVNIKPVSSDWGGPVESCSRLGGFQLMYKLLFDIDPVPGPGPDFSLWLMW